MNILFHNHEFVPQPSGVGSYMHQMACALGRLGHRCTVVTGRVEAQPEQESTPFGSILRLYDRSEMRSPRVRDLVLDVARQNAIDWIEGADHLGETASILRVRKRPPVVIKIHGSNPLSILARVQVLHPWQRATIQAALWRNWRQTGAERYSIEHADCVLVPCHRMLAEVRREGLRLPARTIVIPNPMDAPPSPPAAGGAPEPTILFVGRFAIGKGIQYLPGILDRVLARVPDAVLEIAAADSSARGMGSLREWTATRLAPHADRVRYLGTLGPDGLASAYARAWVTILPTRWDNFPTVVLESMARAKPTVTTPNGGMPEMLHGTGCPTVAPDSPEFADAIAHFLTDSRAREGAGRAAWEKVARDYAPDVVARQYITSLSA